ncbi:mannuronan C-5 epimerase [Ectocarpus siliculosus]|uniref:Mannuronan C-5 epimerase n=1 Tax=Ectocarpus siliculosus TaxID=2880 RepID=D8LKL1_ECTSI|nr:mannuronan C-5 epimerase [Ectocarpus siliculosus]|eukprot:CBN74601.1 mannuronan C-5 epimerase [Ectocarpus siliculosus]
MPMTHTRTFPSVLQSARFCCFSCLRSYWLFTSDVYIYDGVKLELHAESGTTGMRLKSDSKVIELRAHGGWLSLLNTELSSWDVDEADYASNYSAPRSYVTAISEVLETPPQTCVGHAKNDAGEARFDSDVEPRAAPSAQHTRFFSLQTYARQQVRGFCVDLSNEDLFDRVNVRGNIRFSDIHHNYFGMYTYGHQDGLWEYNLMHENAKYGFDPHDDSDNLRIHNNIVWDNGDHGIIASKRCNHVSIQNNVVYDNTNAGIMLHRSSDYATVRNNTVSGSGDACIAIFESMDGIYMYEGSDLPYVSDGLPSYNLIANNIIDTATEGIKMGNTVGNEFMGNVITNTADLRFRNSSGVIWKDNDIPVGVDIDPEGSCFTSDSDIAQLGEEAIVC